MVLKIKCLTLLLKRTDCLRCYKLLPRSGGYLTSYPQTASQAHRLTRFREKRYLEALNELRSVTISEDSEDDELMLAMRKLANGVSKCLPLLMGSGRFTALSTFTT